MDFHRTAIEPDEIAGHPHTLAVVGMHGGVGHRDGIGHNAFAPPPPRLTPKTGRRTLLRNLLVISSVCSRKETIPPGPSA